MKIASVLLFVFFVINLSAQNREKAFEINEKLGRGINYGNMFEAPSETEWGNPWKSSYAEKIADLGFNHIRIPIRWEPANRSSAVAPFTINSSFLNRIKQVVDSALNNGLYAIINMHHHEALFEDPDGQKDRFLAQWKQISAFFKDYPDSLLFELLNEPNGNIMPEKWNIFAADALSTIRQDNPERIVLVATPEWGGLGGLPYLELPDDENIILTVHYYNPFHFTHQGASWVGEEADDWLGTKWNDSETEREIVQNDFAPLKAFEEKNHVPVHIGEFGSYSTADIKSRGKWTTYISRYLETLNWSWAYWEFSAGFGIYEPAKNKYNQILVDALVHNEMPEPSKYVGTPVYTSNFQTSNDGWNLQVHQGSGTLSRAENSLEVIITNGGAESWHLQLNKTNIKLVDGKKYRFSFKAKADTERTATCYLGKNSDPWDAYSGYNGFSLSDTFAVYTFVFDMKTTDNSSRIVFDLGNSTSDFSIKEVLLEEIVLVPPTNANVIEDFSSTIYPNPVIDYLYVNNTDDFEEYRIINMQGRILKQSKLVPFLNEINLDQLPAGIYFISLTGDNELLTSKLIKN